MSAETFSGRVLPRLKTSSCEPSSLAAMIPSTMSETYVKSRCSSVPSALRYSVMRLPARMSCVKEKYAMSGLRVVSGR
eukprot:scaffold64430_cov47-Phaeocystis_antarctica.AAC.3